MKFRELNTLHLIQDAIISAEKQLSSSSTSRLDAEVLLAHVLNFSRAQLYSQDKKVLSSETIKRYKLLVHRRKRGEPVAYILGSKEFWSLNFLVTKEVLIPRPETEMLVELALSQFSKNNKIRVVDLGAGCANIALSIGYERPYWEIIATDQSNTALTIAKQNRKRLHINNVKFYLSNWCDQLPENHFELMVSNPPYIALNDVHLKQGDVRFEPKMALVSGDNGLQDIKIIVSQAKKYLVKGGLLMVEHGYQQGKNVRKFFEQNGYNKVKTVRDLSSLERVTLGRK